MKKQWMILIMISVLAVLAIYQSSSENQEEYPKRGFKAPSFTLHGLDGQSYSMNNLEGKPVVINFWASWCGPCKTEAPELVKLYDKFGDQFVMYAVNMTNNDNEQAARTFADSYGFIFPVLLDQEGVVSNKYRVQSIPSTFFIDREGRIADMVMGLINPQDFEDKVISLIQ